MSGFFYGESMGRTWVQPGCQEWVCCGLVCFDPRRMNKYTALFHNHAVLASLGFFSW